MNFFKDFLKFKLKLNRLKRFISGKAFSGHALGLSDLLLYAKMIDDGIILQTDGSFLAAFWFKGSDMETSTDEELTVLSEQLNRAFSLLNSGWMIHIDTIRHVANDYTAIDRCNFSDPTSYLIDVERRTIYENQGDHYENTYAISFTFRPKIDFGSKLGIFFQRNTSKTNYDFSHYLRVFKHKLQEITELLSLQLHIVAMSNNEILSYINWCLTGELVKLQLPIHYGVFLKHYLASKDLVGGEAPKIGDNFIHAVSISGFPSESYPGILDKLNYLNFEYRWNTRFILLNQYEGNKIIDRISNLWYQKRVGAFDTVKMSLAIDSYTRINQNSEVQHNDAEAAKCLNESGNARFGFYTATVIIMDTNKNLSEQKANQVRSIFRAMGFQGQIERYHALEAYLGTLPGYSYANVRKWLVHSLNVADIMPSTSIWSGLAYNPCSFYAQNSPPLFYAQTTGCTPIRISLHVGDNGHTLILGPTGSGKSTLLNFIIAQHFRYRKAKVFVFDKNHSSLPLCYSCRGNFFDIGAEDNQIYFQPLANLESDLDFDFAVNWIEELCLLNGLAGKFTEGHRLAIQKGLKLMQKETPVERRTLSYFRHLVQDYDKAVAQVLDIFSREQRNIYDTESNNLGFIAKIFDANCNNLNLNKHNFNVFEMGILMQQGDKIIIPVIRYLIHSINKQLDSAEPTLIIFDECFIFFSHPLFRERIIEWIKTVRKFNVAIVFATQELADFFKYPDLASSLKTNCATKIFLPNKNALSTDSYTQYKAVGLNDKQINLIAHGVRGEYFYFSELGNRKFTLELNHNQATFAYVAKTSHQDIKRAKLIYSKSPEQFGYSWLQECGISEQLMQAWLDYNEFLSRPGVAKPCLAKPGMYKSDATVTGMH
ncbi:MAG: type secretion system protein TrbE [Pseudomonadota bacterium]|nr:type secretion system protein TrbE [Pseudomonadota bacterium]